MYTYSLANTITFSDIFVSSQPSPVISTDNVYQFLLYFDKLYDQFTDLEKKTFMNSFIERVEIYPERRSDGRIVKRIEFRFPVYFNGSKITGLGWDETDMSETVMVLSKLSNIEQTGLR